MTEDMIIRREGAAGFLTLNRPKAIHALTQPPSMLYRPYP